MLGRGLMSEWVPNHKSISLGIFIKWVISCFTRRKSIFVKLLHEGKEIYGENYNNHLSIINGIDFAIAQSYFSSEFRQRAVSFACWGGICSYPRKVCWTWYPYSSVSVGSLFTTSLQYFQLFSSDSHMCSSILTDKHFVNIMKPYKWIIDIVW